MRIISSLGMDGQTMGLFDTHPHKERSLFGNFPPLFALRMSGRRGIIFSSCPSTLFCC